LYCATVPVAIAGDIIKHYDEHHNIIGYTVIDGDRQTHYDNSWNRTGHTDKACGTLPLLHYSSLSIVKRNPWIFDIAHDRFDR